MHQKNNILRNKFKQVDERSMYENIQDTHEGNVSNTQMEHISYLLTGRINNVNIFILPTAIYIFTAVSQNSKAFFTKLKLENSTPCIKLLLFSCQDLPDSV